MLIMAQAPKEKLQLITLANDDQKPSTSEEESPRTIKDRKLSDSRAFRPSWRFGQTRSSRESAREEKRTELPNVLRESMVQCKIIPPLPRLSLQEEMPDKLSRMLRKLECLMMNNPAEDDLPRDATDSATPGPSKAKSD